MADQRGHKQQCYTKDCNANGYNKIFTNKNIEYIYKIELNKNTNPKRMKHRPVQVCTDKDRLNK